ncbi:Lipopolysaccharide export system permease protein LptG [Candidatus Ecksteinia adelgidicola]|nr:Lipopolysaccharide export system permease protein LptG [Candidatus Ecksteinia adelgidicola]
MFRILDRYICKTIFYIIINVLFLLISLSSIIKFIDQLRIIGEGTYTILDACIFTILNIPKDVEIFFPTSVLLGALLGLGQLSTRNELIIMQASSFTRTQIIKSVIKTSIPLVLIIMAINEWITPISNSIARDFRTQKISGKSSLINQNGIWIKDKNNFVYIEHVLRKQEFSGIHIYTLNNHKQLKNIRHALSSKFEKSRWKLFKVNCYDLTKKNKIIQTKIDKMYWNTDLMPNKITMLRLDPSLLSIRELYTYIQYLKKNNQESKKYQLNIWKKIFLPITVSVMIMIATSCIFGPLSNVSVGIRTINGILFGLFFYFLDILFGQLILIYHVLPILGALLPDVSFFFIALYILLKLKK